MSKVLIVDDSVSKVGTLFALFRELDSGKRYELVTAIEPRAECGDHDDRGTVLRFLDAGGLEDVVAIFQDKNLSGVEGHELAREYLRRGFQGPIIQFTASDWNWYQADARFQLNLGYTAVFPWGEDVRPEQVRFMLEHFPELAPQPSPPPSCCPG
ncbi:MAG: hypothetical protein V1735_04695 [Nanoarchaeota archaeon]